jgi:hypothetical protein
VAQTLQEPTLLEQQDELRNVPDEPADSGAQEAPAP